MEKEEVERGRNLKCASCHANEFLIGLVLFSAHNEAVSFNRCEDFSPET